MFQRSAVNSVFNSAGVTGVHTGPLHTRDRIDRRQRLSAGVLQRIDQHLPARSFVYRVFERNQPGQLVIRDASHQFRKASCLPVGVVRFERHKNMKAGGSRSFEKTGKPYGIQNYVNSPRDFKYRGKGRSRRGIQIEKNVVRESCVSLRLDHGLWSIQPKFVR